MQRAAGERRGAADRRRTPGCGLQAKCSERESLEQSFGAGLLRHMSRDLSRRHGRGLSVSNDRGTGKPSAELFDKLPPRQLAVREHARVWRYSSVIFDPLECHLWSRNSASPCIANCCLTAQYDQVRIILLHDFAERDPQRSRIGTIALRPHAPSRREA